MHSLLATTVLDQSTSGSFLTRLIHDFLPMFALASGLMVLIWLGCAVIALCGYVIGAVLVFGVHACLRHVRQRRAVECAQLVTAHADSARAKVISLDRNRRRQRHFARAQPTRTPQRRFDDDPA